MIRVKVSDEINVKSSEVELENTSDVQNMCPQRESVKGNEKTKPQRKFDNSEPKWSINDNSEMLLRFFTETSKKLGQQIKRAFFFIWIDLEGNKIFDHFAQWCIRHPHLAVCIIAAGLVTFVPIFLFLAFSLSTLVMTFIGLLVLEGTVLTILSMIMFGLFGALVIALLFLAVIGFTTYFGVTQIYDKYSSTDNTTQFIKRHSKDAQI